MSHRKNITVLLAFSIFLFFSCTKRISITPEFQLDAGKPLASLDDADNALTGAYSGFLDPSYFNGTSEGSPSAFSALPDVMSDDLIETFESLGNFRRYSEWSYPGDDPFSDSAWLHAYSVVSSVNIILRDIDKLASKDQKAANRIKGQALAIRGMVHFDLLRLYAPDLQRNSAALGVPYVKVFDITLKPARNTVKECYDNILADMQQAAGLLADVDKDINTDLDKGHIDLLAVNGLLSRINLYAGQWQDAVNAATPVIQNVPLATADDFPNIWTDASVAEVLWS
ncbi:MAG TPA: RagB/SusD family nutrient uptake outer membrane protein, partial [Puia sp.]|nr:RagB/SusD family nutrient uptake outer membrane protein [Puia sp.]